MPCAMRVCLVAWRRWWNKTSWDVFEPDRVGTLLGCGKSLKHHLVQIEGFNDAFTKSLYRPWTTMTRIRSLRTAVTGNGASPTIWCRGSHSTKMLSYFSEPI